MLILASDTRHEMNLIKDFCARMNSQERALHPRSYLLHQQFFSISFVIIEGICIWIQVLFFMQVRFGFVA